MQWTNSFSDCDGHHDVHHAGYPDLQQNYCQDPPQASPPPWATFDEEGKEVQERPSYSCYWWSIVVIIVMIVMILVIVIVILLLFSITILITVTILFISIMIKWELFWDPGREWTSGKVEEEFRATGGFPPRSIRPPPSPPSPPPPPSTWSPPPRAPPRLAPAAPPIAPACRDCLIHKRNEKNGILSTTKKSPIISGKKEFEI